jgi:hypothetical protein
VINDLDDTLAELLRRTLPPTLVPQVAISFAPPDGTFPPPSVTLPAIDLFLYDIRENRTLRSNERQIERDPEGTVVLRPPSLRLDCSYLVTAWPSATTINPVQDEHHLISQVMMALLRYPVLPRPLLQGALAAQPLPPPVTALQAGSLQSMGEFWQALGRKPRAALHVTATIAVEAGRAAEEGSPVLDIRTRLTQTTGASGGRP